ncbi:hypothetical protein AB0M05_38730 [Streptomyces violaceusniger]|uniref:hypothetical protein n=1 Tax=Streptomyces violaceusniger TaxID=68280 RepID=UPI00342CAF13
MVTHRTEVSCECYLSLTFRQFQYPTAPLSRSRDGIHDLLDIETARATVDTLATLNADLSEGVGISGPAARRAITQPPTHRSSSAP